MPVWVPENPLHCAAAVGTPPEASDSPRHVPFTWKVAVLVRNAVQVYHASSRHGQVTAAVGARAPATPTGWLIVPAVGSMPSRTASVAADVVAVVPYASRCRARPTGLGLSFSSQPPGSPHTVFVPRTPENAASVVYVFFVIAVVSVYSNSAWVPVIPLMGPFSLSHRLHRRNRLGLLAGERGRGERHHAGGVVSRRRQAPGERHIPADAQRRGREIHAPVHAVHRHRRRPRRRGRTPSRQKGR